MDSNLQYAGIDTPTPAAQWVGSSESERCSRIAKAMSTGEEKIQRLLSLISAKEDGQVIVRINEPLSPGERGTLLLDFEAYLKVAVDPGLAVWVEALGDKNSLRNLRGIEVKA